VAIHLQDVNEETLWFAATCAHVEETADWDRGGAVRKVWIEEMLPQALQIKVALGGGQPIAFIHLLPIEHTALGLKGQDLLTISCLSLKDAYQGRGIGRLLTVNGHQIGWGYEAPREWLRAVIHGALAGCGTTRHRANGS
jgi:GNAT superfamily N-acetyltransferase